MPSSSEMGTGKIKKSSDIYANVSMSGCTPGQIDYMKLKVITGRNLTQKDLEKKKRVCVIADTMAYRYFENENPIGQQIVYEREDGSAYSFTVVGVYEYSEAVFGRQDTTVPEKTVRLPYLLRSLLSMNLPVNRKTDMRT